MSNFKKQFYQLIEKTEDKAFTKPAFELFEKKTKIKSKLKYYGTRDGLSYYRGDIKPQDELKHIFTNLCVEAQVDEINHVAAFMITWTLKNLSEDGVALGKVVEENGKLKYIAADEQPKEVEVQLPTLAVSL